METRITHSLIKAVSGEFDLENVFKLSLTRMNVRKIENLEECVNLQELNLSGNELTAIEGLHRLHNLRKLTLTSNKITSLSGLEKLNSLEHVLIQENDISNIAELSALAGLPNLKGVYLKNIDGSQKNPLCDHPSYRSSIVRQLPKLTILDGERLKHSQTLYADAPAAPSAAPSVRIPESKPWLADFTWGDEDEVDVDKLLGSVQSRFDSVNQESRKLNAAAVSLLSHYQ
ncbi:hypothetical protein T484DRAFT_1953658 [Baffinella frigidus]|nr:hypothetical protein T484DRAFT_1953658 [Cryptophyta sp. CCMP2293]|mmetsp:Transcript_58084/g.138256  ORF Transcript_58084/g.138256 Transcript_58084/m.138256 type:complete len:230 (+) Transcript_58084:202-891(+)